MTLKQTLPAFGLMTVLALAMPACSGDNPMGGGGGGGGGAGGNLTIALTWTTMGDMDVGATTPNGFIAAGSPPGNDPNCTHGGDSFGTGTNNSETMACNPAAAGSYTIVVENYDGSATIGYTVSVQVNGSQIHTFSGSAPPNATLGNGTEIRHSFSLS
jgi:hypothetical protein